jgi:hypothetical protein
MKVVHDIESFLLISHFHNEVFTVLELLMEKMTSGLEFDSRPGVRVARSPPLTNRHWVHPLGAAGRAAGREVVHLPQSSIVIARISICEQ